MTEKREARLSEIQKWLTHCQRIVKHQALGFETTALEHVEYLLSLLQQPVTSERCGSCGRTLVVDWKFCGGCGVATTGAGAGTGQQRRVEIALGYIKRAANKKIPDLPCRVDEMTERELAIFKVCSKATGTLQFIAREVAALETHGDFTPAAVAEGPPHHKHCSIWTVNREGQKQPCDCICTCTHSMGQHIRPGEHYWYEDCAEDDCPCLKFTAAPAPVQPPAAPQDGFQDFLPLTPVRVAPGEYEVKTRDGRTLWGMEGAALADWVCASVNGYDAAIGALPSTTTPGEGAREALLAFRPIAASGGCLQKAAHRLQYLIIESDGKLLHDLQGMADVLRGVLTESSPSTEATYMHEDELPVNMPKEDYDKWHAQSWIPNGAGCRVGPRYPFKATQVAAEAAATEIFNYVHETDGGHKADFTQRRVIEIISKHCTADAGEVERLARELEHAAWKGFNQSDSEFEKGYKHAMSVAAKRVRESLTKKEGEGGP